MAKKILAFLNLNISYKTFLVLLVIATSIILFPMIYIARWDVPSADDYSFSSGIHRVIMNNGSLLEIIKANLDVVKSAYHNWSGLFSSYAMTMFMPALYGSQNYRFVLYMMLSILVLGVLAFILEVLSFFTNKKKFVVMISMVLLIACTQFLPSPVQGFYWYSGSAVYTFFFGLSLLYYALIVRWLRRGVSVFFVMLINVLSVIIAACNFVTALCTAILLTSLMILLIICKNSFWKKLLLPMLFFAVTFYFVVSAPGNTVRQSASQSLPFIQTILESFRLAGRQIITFNKLSVIALYFLLLPLLWKIASESDYSFNYPWLVTLYSFCLQASMNSPTIYANAEWTPGRVENIRYFAMLILFVINIFYWLGWISKGRFRQIGNRILQMRVFYLILCSVVFLYGLTKIPFYRITSLSAVHSYKLGWVGQYKHVYNQRLTILEDPDIQDAVLREYPRSRPFILFFDDIYEDPNNWRNKAMSDYFGKNTVRLRHPDEPLPGIFDGD